MGYAFKFSLPLCPIPQQVSTRTAPPTGQGRDRDLRWVGLKITAACVLGQSIELSASVLSQELLQQGYSGMTLVPCYKSHGRNTAPQTCTGLVTQGHHPMHQVWGSGLNWTRKEEAMDESSPYLYNEWETGIHSIGV